MRNKKPMRPLFRNNSCHPGISVFSALLVMLFFMRGALAHEFWIVPHDPVMKSNEKVVFELRIGSGLPGKKTARIPGLIKTFSAWDTRGSVEVDGHDNSFVVGHLDTRVSGATVAGLRTNQAKITLPASEFEAYLHEEGLTKIIDMRKKEGESILPSVEMFSRCAKSIILVDGESNGFDHILGMPLELIPLTDPLHFSPEKPFTLQLLQDGRPFAGAQVKAQIPGTQPIKLTAITDEQGKVSFTLPKTGFWLFSTVDMQRSTDLNADWDSLWSSLSVMLGQGYSS
ncbi:DUF4198 domain-containing protein [Serratia proteamaculans]|uniref:DUF4198 domain-containing protein n=1 Tax=Serratia proteamaculans TaxID=28151 RepID=UPI001432727D|nr:DUF4198 domain-containing protein [Serratia proteamaculans]